MAGASAGRGACAGHDRRDGEGYLGAILPGVTVEAASPALIEKVRSAVTDGAGQYRIENLRPGDYTVTFTLPGFSTVRREGLELNAFLTVTINAELKVGGVEETITVTGETPVVDVQSAQRQTVLTNEVISAIPTVGSYNALLVLVPAIFGGQQDVSTGPCNSCTFSSHGTLLDGGRANREARLLVDGISIAVPQAGGTNYLTDTRNAQEVSFTTSGSLGEVESGGPVMNIVPKSGGNTLSGSIFATWGNGDLQGSNYSDELKAAGLTAPNPLIKAYDFNSSLGGPISRDRLWFFGTLRFQGNSNYIANMYENMNAGDPNKWTYEPDFSRQAFKDQTWQNASGRLTRAAQPAEQGERVLGRAEGLSEVRERRPRRQRHHVARGQHLRGPGPDALPAGHLLVAGQQQVAARRRLRLLLLAVGRPRQGESEHEQPGADGRAVHGRLPGEREHRRASTTGRRRSTSSAIRATRTSPTRGVRRARTSPDRGASSSATPAPCWACWT